MNQLTLSTIIERAFPRRRAYLGGKVVYGEAFCLDCVVRDMSEAGARIQIPDGLVVPDSIQLISLKDAKAFDAEVVWRRYPLLGLRFRETYDLEKDVPPQARHLKRLWSTSRELGSTI